MNKIYDYFTDMYPFAFMILSCISFYNQDATEGIAWMSAFIYAAIAKDDSKPDNTQNPKQG